MKAGKGDDEKVDRSFVPRNCPWRGLTETRAGLKTTEASAREWVSMSVKDSLVNGLSTWVRCLK